MMYQNVNQHSCTCYLLVGMPGSGKSTWCTQCHPSLPVVSRDQIRAELGYTKDAQDKAVLDPELESIVTLRENALMEGLAARRQDFIVDDTNIKKVYRDQIIKFLKSLGVRVIGVQFDTPLELCIERRKNQIDSESMNNLFAKMAPLDNSEVDEIIIWKCL